jgi:general secretion pathway protein G
LLTIISKGQKMKAERGFTLVEILIVVVILGILAAIVIPQFTEASTEAKTSSLVTDLQSVRSQIELYKVQHNDNLPGVVATNHPTDVSFEDAMKGYTTVGGVGTTQDDPNGYGPYLMKIPVNQFTDSINIGKGTADPPASVVGGGWYFNTDNGKFWAIDTDDHVAL